jgi:Glycosyl hydrolases family 43
MKRMLLAFLVSLAAARAQVEEFRPGQAWPDRDGVHINAHGGGIFFHEGTYYWCGQFMVEGEAGNTAQVGVSMYGSRDLHRWKNEGIALAVSEDPGSEIFKGCLIERPKVIFNRKTGKFVMWFHLELKGKGYHAARSGVAVADKAIGPYRYLGSFRPNAGVWPMNVPEELRKPLSKEESDALANKRFPGGPTPDHPKADIFRLHHEGGQMARDMNLFVDDDGTAYHIYASEHNSTLHLSQLTDDYLKPAGKYLRLFPGAFREAPAMFKHQGRYYLFTSGCSGWKPNPARLASAEHIFGPWTDLGDPCIGPPEQTRTTFHSQPTCVLPVQGKPGAFIYMGDRWNPSNPIEATHIWLPVRFDKDGKPFLQWMDEWDFGFFE